MATRRRIPSEFVPLDVNYARDRAIRCVGVAGEVLFVRSLAHARLHKTDGFVADFDLSALSHGIRRASETARLLVREGLWSQVDGGWRIRSWGKWNGASVQVEAQRAAESEGGSRGAHKRWHSDMGVINADCAYCDPNRGANGVPYVGSNGPSIAEGEGEGEEKETLSSEVADATFRPDVSKILDHLDDRIRANGAKVPNRTKKNVDAARLLLDRDARSVDQVILAIDFATGDEFWRTNILSMSKLREKYEQLRMAAQRPGRPGSPSGRTRPDVGTQDWLLR